MDETANGTLKPLWRTFTFWQSMAGILTQPLFILYCEVMARDVTTRFPLFLSYLIFPVIILSSFYPFASIFFSIDFCKERTLIRRSFTNWIPVILSGLSLIFPIRVWGEILLRLGIGLYYSLIHPYF